MKTKLLLTILLLLTFLLPSQGQERLQFGFQSNVGLFGRPKTSTSKNETDLSQSTFTQIPNLAFSGGALLEYTFVKIQNWSLSIQVEAGYTYTSFYKIWNNKWGYDTAFENHTRENQFVHDLQAHYFNLPLKGNMKIKKLRLTLGYGLTRTIYASGTRTFKTRRGTPLGPWTSSKLSWLTSEKESTAVELNESYLNRFYSTQVFVGVGYQFKENLFIGVEAGNLTAHSVSLYANINSPIIFYYNGNMLSLSFLFFN